MRPSAHGDVCIPPVRSTTAPTLPADRRPLRGNDGVLRAINGNRSNAIGPWGGSELWSFVAPEFFRRSAVALQQRADQLRE